MAAVYTEPPQVSCATAERPGRFPLDDALRDAKPPFKILLRPEHGPVLWTRGGRVYTEAQAVACVGDEP
jgi:hypothetical protein